MPVQITGLLKPSRSNGLEYNKLPSESITEQIAAPIAEPKKTVISSRIWDILVWHIWTIISVCGTITLLTLNFRGYGGFQLGAGHMQTRNILGAMQLAAKAHEITIVASLVTITKQLILRSLINDGILLGLLGAEVSLAYPSFLLSKSYRASVSYGIHGIFRQGGRARRLRMCLITGFIFIACALSSLAGPASAVLVIPRLDWFFDSEFKHSDAKLSCSGEDYPYILIAPRGFDPPKPFNIRTVMRSKVILSGKSEANIIGLGDFASAKGNWKFNERLTALDAQVQSQSGNSIVWIAEGPKSPDNLLFSSMDIVIEIPNSNTKSPKITVCSVFAEMKSADVFSFGFRAAFSAQQVEYLGHLIHSDGTQTAPQKVQYHESFLPAAHAQIPVSENNSTESYYLRIKSQEPYARNVTESYQLSVFGETVRKIYNSSVIEHNRKELPIDASDLEIRIGGAYIYMLSLLEPAKLQYAVGNNTLPLLVGGLNIPEEQQFCKPEDPSHRSTKVYKLAFRFGLSTRTGILGAAVLITHVVIAVLASLFQLFWRQNMIKGWKTIPDYTALGIGSTSKEGVLENTCAGISGEETLKSFVRVGETAPGHLEISVVGSVSPEKDDLKKIGRGKYGFRGRNQIERKEKFE